MNKKSIEISANYSSFHAFFYNIENEISSNKNNNNPILGKVKLPNLNFKFLFQNDNLLFKIFDIEMGFADSDRMRGILGNILLLVEEKFKNSLLILEPVMKRIKDENRLVNNQVEDTSNNKKRINTNTSDANLNAKNEKSSKSGFSNILQNNILNEKQNKMKVINKNKKDQSLDGSNNTSFMDVNVPTHPEAIFKNKNMNEIPPIINKNQGKVVTNNTNKQYTDTFQNEDVNDEEMEINSSQSGIIQFEKSFENISDYEDLGITIEKSKPNPQENVKKIQSFNRLDSEKTEESQGHTKKKNKEITATGNASGSVKLKLKNSGNINLMNINIK